MSNTSTQLSAFSDSKPHYPILDGLRGVAAMLLVPFHLLEPFSGGNHAEQMMNHGYLAVDFFFVLSGFVIGYAYDDRWGSMSLGGFFKRRLIRLHPMIIMAMVIGAVLFYPSASADLFPKVGETPVWALLAIMFIGWTMIPVPVSMDIRGWNETYPLNGPAWSLFYEYIANILYAFVLRKLPNAVLTWLTMFAGIVLLYFALTNPHGDLIGGWSLEAEQLRVGFTRLMYPFLAGLLISRVYKPGRVRHAFWWCSLLIFTAFSIPRVGGTELWQNGLYDALVVLFVFPLVVFLGASGYETGQSTARICRWLGDISYPLYITHFPLVYVFSAWVVNERVALENAWGMIVLTFVMAVSLAYACLKWYDVPVRRWLQRKWL